MVSSKGGFAASRPGAYAFLARSAEGVTADFVHLEVLDPSSVELWAGGQRVVDLKLAGNQTIDVAALALAQDGTPLAGASTWSWALSGDPVVKLQPLGQTGAGGAIVADDEVTLVAGAG